MKKVSVEEVVVLLSRTSCHSSKKARAFLEEHTIPFIEINIKKDVIPSEYLLTILEFTEDGIKDVLKRGVKEDDFLDMNLFEFINIVKSSVDTQNILKSPILLQGDYKVNIGYNEDEIRVFLPEEEKAKELARLYEAEKMAI